MTDYVLSFPPDFDGYAWEVEAKGYFSLAVLTVRGKRYCINFYDPVRLQQTIDDQRDGIYFEPNLVVIASVTRVNMEKAIERLVRSGNVSELVADTRELTLLFISELVAHFPGLKPLLDEHIRDQYFEILPHVLLGGVTDYVISLLSSDLLEKRSELHGILSHLDQAYAGGGDQVQELISVSFLERLPRPDEEGGGIRGLLGPHLKTQLDLIG